MPPLTFETRACWIDLPVEVKRRIEAAAYPDEVRYATDVDTDTDAAATVTTAPGAIVNGAEANGNKIDSTRGDYETHKDVASSVRGGALKNMKNETVCEKTTAINQHTRKCTRGCAGGPQHERASPGQDDGGTAKASDKERIEGVVENFLACDADVEICDLSVKQESKHQVGTATLFFFLAFSKILVIFTIAPPYTFFCQASTF